MAVGRHARQSQEGLIACREMPGQVRREETDDTRSHRPTGT